MTPPFFCQFFQTRNLFYLIVSEASAIVLALCWCYPQIAPLY